jgi:sRNA-binding regulator protein Hfq
MKHKLEGLTAALFLDGGWTITGVIESSDDEKLVIKSEGQLYLVFKCKVSAMSILEDGQSAPIKHNDVNSDPPQSESQAHTFPENRMHYDESAMSIPKSMLNKLDEAEDSNFSAFFGGAATTDAGAGGMSFVVEGEDDPKE